MLLCITYGLVIDRDGTVLIPNATKGAILGVAVATAFALLHALAPTGPTPHLADWSPRDPNALHRFLSTFLYVLPFGILVGSLLGTMADDLSGFVQRLCVLVILAAGFAAVASAFAPALTEAALVAAAAHGIGLAWWAAPAP